MRPKDGDGFYFWNFMNVSYSEKNIVVQSHDGYKCNDSIHFECWFEKPVRIQNVLDRPIKVRITEFPYNQYWVDMEPGSYIDFQ